MEMPKFEWDDGDNNAMSFFFFKKKIAKHFYCCNILLVMYTYYFLISSYYEFPNIPLERIRHMHIASRRHKTYENIEYHVTAQMSYAFY